MGERIVEVFKCIGYNLGRDKAGPRWEANGVKLDDLREKPDIPKHVQVKEGDRVVVVKGGVRPKTFHLPSEKYGRHPIILYKSRKDWEWAITTENITLKEVGEQELPVFKKAFKGGVTGDLIVGFQQDKLMCWDFLSKLYTNRRLIVENAVVFDKTEREDYSNIEASPPDELVVRADREIRKLEEIKRKADKVLDLLRTDPSASLDNPYGKELLEYLVTNIQPSPVAGTTLPLDLFNLIADAEYVRQAAPAAGGPDLNAMTGQFQRTPPPDVASGQAGTAAANSFIQALGSVYSFIMALRERSASLQQGRLGAAKTAAGDALGSAMKMVKGLVDGINSAISAAGTLTQAAAQTTGAAMAGVGGGLGVLISGLAVTRSARKIHRARDRLAVLKGMTQQDELLDDFRGCIDYAVIKLSHRANKQAGMIGSALLGGVGGTLLMVTAIIGVANAWNPAGWAIIGAGALVGIGLGAYTLYRRYTRSQREERRKGKFDGVCNTKVLAQRLVDIATNNNHRNQKQARSMLFLFGVDYVEELLPGKVKEIEKEIDRHFNK